MHIFQTELSWNSTGVLSIHDVPNNFAELNHACEGYMILKEFIHDFPKLQRGIYKSNKNNLRG